MGTNGWRGRQHASFFNLDLTFATPCVSDIYNFNKNGAVCITLWPFDMT